MGRVRVDVQNLCMAAGGRVLQRDLRFEVHAAEVLPVIGASGCGKSTLLRHLLGLREPLAGRVHVDTAFGVTFRAGALWSSMTVGGNVMLPLELYTALPLLDEPGAGLDLPTAARIDELLLALRDHLGTAVVIVTRELDSICRIADRALFLDVTAKTKTALAPPQALAAHGPPAVHAFLHRQPRWAEPSSWPRWWSCSAPSWPPPAVFRGVDIGHVTAIGLVYDEPTGAFSIPVEVEFDREAPRWA